MCCGPMQQSETSEGSIGGQLSFNQEDAEARGAGGRKGRDQYKQWRKANNPIQSRGGIPEPWERRNKEKTRRRLCWLQCVRSVGTGDVEYSRRLGTWVLGGT